IRVLIATLATGVTVPSRSTRTGTCFFMATATSTGTARSPPPRAPCVGLSPPNPHGIPSSGMIPVFAPATTATASHAAHRTIRFLRFISDHGATHVGPTPLLLSGDLLAMACSCLLVEPDISENGPPLFGFML